MPKKPTETFGHIAFRKGKKAIARLFRLSDDKKIQERQVIEKFIEIYNECNIAPYISNYRQLPENDHDFIICTNDGDITVQVTEFASRQYSSPVASEDPTLGRVIDSEVRTSSLKELLDKKLRKYARGSNEVLWLIIFAIGGGVPMEYIEGASLVKSETLLAIQEYFRGKTHLIFDAIWFTNLQTRPIKIWPL